MAAFTGGGKMQAHLAALAAKLTSAKTVQVGFLAGSTYPDGTPTAMVAAIHEFGAPRANIPPRPFFRPMIASKSGDWGDALGRVLKQADYDAAKALAQMGKGIEGQLVQSIKDVPGPPLAPATVAAKGFDKLLVDTGHMLNSVASKVD